MSWPCCVSAWVRDWAIFLYRRSFGVLENGPIKSLMGSCGYVWLIGCNSDWKSRYCQKTDFVKIRVTHRVGLGLSQEQTEPMNNFCFFHLSFLLFLLVFLHWSVTLPPVGNVWFVDVICRLYMETKSKKDFVKSPWSSYSGNLPNITRIHLSSRRFELFKRKKILSVTQWGKETPKYLIWISTPAYPYLWFKWYIPINDMNHSCKHSTRFCLIN